MLYFNFFMWLDTLVIKDQLNYLDLISCLHPRFRNNGFFIFAILMFVVIYFYYDFD